MLFISLFLRLSVWEEPDIVYHYKETFIVKNYGPYIYTETDVTVNVRAASTMSKQY